MWIAREGWREIGIATVLAALVAWGLVYWHPLAALAPLPVWIWVVAFFRDPPRDGRLAPGQMASPADGRVTEITRLDHHEDVGGPAIRVGIFLSIFNVHINRSPCDGRVLRTHHQPGRYLDARHPDSGRLNEANTLVLDAAPKWPSPVVIRQVAGQVARRIICYAEKGTSLDRGQRFGLIKFGSRTELIVPADDGIEVLVAVGTRVKAGLTPLLSCWRGGEAPVSGTSASIASAD